MNLAFDIDPSVLASVRRDSEEFVRELRLAAAVKWYEDALKRGYGPDNG